MLQGKFFKIILTLAIFILVWVHYTRYYDFAQGCYIKIVPSILEFSNSNIKRAIKVIKSALPLDYAILCSYAKIINPSPSCGGFGGGCFYSDKPKTIYITTSQNDLLGTVGVIVHEVCHARQRYENKPLNEEECYREDDRVFRSITVF